MSETIYPQGCDTLSVSQIANLVLGFDEGEAYINVVNYEIEAASLTRVTCDTFSLDQIANMVLTLDGDGELAIRTVTVI
jgi:hypothetical protein